MPVPVEEIVTLFKQGVEGALVENNPQVILEMMTEDVIGIGMGSQGIVTGKVDATRIMTDGKADVHQSKTEIEYTNVQARCYDEGFGTVCALLQITTTTAEKVVVSTLGQLMNFCRVDGRWMVYAIQATPLFNQIEELEAYPIKFAENVLETYRQQERIAENAQSDSVAVYLVNFTKGTFESATLKKDFLVSPRKGELYENVMFTTARQYLQEEECYRFVSTFSLGNVFKAYHSGQTELSMEYQMYPSDRPQLWLKTIIKLYIDKASQHLMGYLYVVDIDEAKKRELELQSRTELDSMTGLYNSKCAQMKIEERLLLPYPECQGVFFMIDLDYFKSINDTYGHLEGDRIIRETASELRVMCRKNDVAGRLGGDEFCIYFQGPMPLSVVAEKARAFCEKIRSLIPAKENKSSCSVGVVICNGPQQSFAELYKKADYALYQQKRNGRDGYTVYSEDLAVQ